MALTFLVSDITPRIAARLNDAAQGTYTNTVLLPFVQDAWDELKLDLDLNGNLAVETITSNPITVPIGVTSLAANSLLPSDMLEPQRVDERLSGTTDLFTEMTPRQWEPQITQTDSLRYWIYRQQDIKFVGATTARDIIIYYKQALIDISSPSDQLNINHCKQFMVNKTAALAAMFIAQNVNKANTLEAKAEQFLIKLRRIQAKVKQRTRTRRKPFTTIGRRNWVP